eukprot:CAMPEP_0205909820 /NCGR_PEP_ID=MMETSP1325-20131115/4106_1 /ASSEMBLY_ACC=CAM_ASM_000708 /TAXON_ID=236786 /ORGANISM="Florenciella sp., Strain RCC1007" /LENGTH=38 /DNA_ID= /DNA_START= /DNA_END= /DNA_ORIENTATION=
MFLCPQEDGEERNECSFGRVDGEMSSSSVKGGSESKDW